MLGGLAWADVVAATPNVELALGVEIASPKRRSEVGGRLSTLGGGTGG